MPDSRGGVTIFFPGGERVSSGTPQPKAANNSALFRRQEGQLSTQTFAPPPSAVAPLLPLGDWCLEEDTAAFVYRRATVVLCVIVMFNVPFLVVGLKMLVLSGIPNSNVIAI